MYLIQKHKSKPRPPRKLTLVSDKRGPFETATGESLRLL